MSETITVYHGSHLKFDKPSLDKGKSYRDFGKGFYVTEHYFDALNILNQGVGYVYEYELTLEGNIKEFGNNNDLLNYIIDNRVQEVEDDYDLVIGGTLANCSRIFKDYRNKGLAYDKEELLNTLENSPYKDQICIKTEEGLAHLKRVNVEEYTEYDFA